MKPKIKIRDQKGVKPNKNDSLRGWGGDTNIHQGQEWG